MPQTMEKQAAHQLIDKMPINATWDDLIHEIYVRETIEKGLEDSNNGKTKDVMEIRTTYGIN
ncbi:MAG: hypothetical protein JNL74_09960 [Fibrobacteres bacterium]|nr:hypothetical protein [Fibrobacterota bacterium]